MLEILTVYFIHYIVLQVSWPPEVQNNTPSPLEKPKLRTICSKDGLIYSTNVTSSTYVSLKMKIALLETVLLEIGGVLYADASKMISFHSMT